MKKIHFDLHGWRPGISFYRGKDGENPAAEHFYLSLDSTLSFHSLAHGVLCAATGTQELLAISRDFLQAVHMTALSLRAACLHALARGDMKNLTSSEKPCMGLLRVFQTTPIGERQGVPEVGEKQNNTPGVFTLLKYPWEGADELRTSKTSANRATEKDN